MPLNFTTRGLPRWSIETMPEEYKADYLVARHLKPWKCCELCGWEARYYCSACGNAKCQDKVRYCNPACQRQDWERHRSLCRDINLLDKQVDIEGTPTQAVFLRKEIRQGRRWMHALKESSILSWLIRQAYLTCPQENPRETCLHFDMVSAFPAQPQAPLWPLSFEFRPLDPELDLSPDVPGYETRPVGHYSYMVNGSVGSKGWVFLDEDEDDLLERPIPQWPWIFAHCAIVGDIHPIIAEVRLKLLLITIENYPMARALLQQFVVTPAFSKFKCQGRLLDRWLQIMYPVVAGVASHFHSPCTLIFDRYKHLL